MAALHKLTVLKIEREKTRGYLNDGGGLYLRISPTGTKSWVFRYKVSIAGRTHTREMGLGALHTVTLAEARERARECRKQRLDDIDPIDARSAKRQTAKLTAARVMTFAACAKRYIEVHRTSWKNEKHAAQWSSTLETYADPVFGNLAVATVDTGLVMKAIELIWQEKPETASRLRGRIESVLDWATVRGYRHGANPARWRGHLDQLLPAPSKAKQARRRELGRAEHHAALPYAELPALLADLDTQEGLGALALKFAILTAARTSEVINARWNEFNLTQRLWTIPAERMKAGRDHRVPLSAPALQILETLRQLPESPFILPAGRLGPVSNMIMLMTLRRMGKSELTVHGFRSTFSDWVTERTGFPPEVREMALAHTISNKVEEAYRRGDLFQKRRQPMDAWAKFATSPAPTGAVVPFAKAAE